LELTGSVRPIAEVDYRMRLGCNEAIQMAYLLSELIGE